MATTYTSVDAYLQDQPADRRAVINVLRETVLGARPGVTEIVKWNSPSFVYQGEDRITVNASAREAVRLIFHAGVATQEDKQALPAFTGDPDGLLRWHSNIRASLLAKDAAEVEARCEAIATVVGNWLDAFAKPAV
jgi:hypothetical protein